MIAQRVKHVCLTGSPFNYRASGRALSGILCHGVDKIVAPRDTIYRKNFQNLPLLSLNVGENTAKADYKLALGEGGDSVGLNRKLAERDKSVVLDRTLSGGLGGSKRSWAF